MSLIHNIYHINIISLVLLKVSVCHRWQWDTNKKLQGFEKWITRNRIFTTCLSKPLLFNSLAPGRPGYHFKTAIFNLVLLIGIFTSSNDNALRWMPWDLTHGKSTLVHVMAWCRQAASHYMGQCSPNSMPPDGVTRPQWVNLTRHHRHNAMSSIKAHNCLKGLYSLSSKTFLMNYQQSHKI